jgi:hypothetical protein
MNLHLTVSICRHARSSDTASRSRYNDAYPNNIFNRVFLPASIVPMRGGAQIAWIVPLNVAR